MLSCKHHPTPAATGCLAAIWRFSYALVRLEVRGRPSKISGTSANISPANHKGWALRWPALAHSGGQKSGSQTNLTSVAIRDLRWSNPFYKLVLQKDGKSKVKVKEGVPPACALA